jgi:hypothetical protein
MNAVLTAAAARWALFSQDVCVPAVLGQFA